jgi:hypothetical protein
MINTLLELSIRWQGKRRQLQTVDEKHLREGERAVYDARAEEVGRCIQELDNGGGGVKPRPLDQTLTAAIYRWAPQLVQVMDLMAQAAAAKEADNTADLASIAYDLGELHDEVFRSALYYPLVGLAGRCPGRS